MKQDLRPAIRSRGQARGHDLRRRARIASGEKRDANTATPAIGRRTDRCRLVTAGICTALLKGGLGSRAARSHDMLSLVLFQHDYIQRLIELGERDAEARAEDIDRFLGSRQE